MAERNEGRAQSPDTVLLASGAIALMISASALLGGARDFWIGWALSGLAVAVGIFLLIASMRRR